METRQIRHANMEQMDLEVNFEGLLRRREKVGKTRVN
jgi:hypothetical protein